jgi:hypothetical protein
VLKSSSLSQWHQGIRLPDLWPGILIGCRRPDQVATSTCAAYAAVVDAFTHPGPADPSRIDRSVCGQLFLPGVTPDSFAVHYATIYATFVPDIAGLTYPPVRSEPPLRCYAQPEACSR